MHGSAPQRTKDNRRKISAQRPRPCITIVAPSPIYKGGVESIIRQEGFGIYPENFATSLTGNCETTPCNGKCGAMCAVTLTADIAPRSSYIWLGDYESRGRETSSCSASARCCS